MSRDQKPGRANIIDGSANRGGVAPPVSPPASMHHIVAPAASVAPVRAGLFVIIFIASSAVAGTGVAVLARLLL